MELTSITNSLMFCNGDTRCITNNTSQDVNITPVIRSKEAGGRWSAPTSRPGWTGRGTDRQGSASALAPSDRAPRPCPPPGRAGSVGVRNMGLWLGSSSIMMIKVENSLYNSCSKEKKPASPSFHAAAPLRIQYRSTHAAARHAHSATPAPD